MGGFEEALGGCLAIDVVYGVMEKFRSCLLEMLLNSKRVKIGGLGTSRSGDGSLICLIC